MKHGQPTIRPVRRPGAEPIKQTEVPEYLRKIARRTVIPRDRQVMLAAAEELEMYRALAPALVTAVQRGL